MTETTETDILSDFFNPSELWVRTFPNAHAGVLAIRVSRILGENAALQERKLELESSLRARFAGMDRAALRALPTLRAYEEHYRRFDKTYHVQLQLESIVLKGKSVPTSAALVEAMFMAEIDSMLLTAGHDLNAIRGPLTLDVARGTESYMLLRGIPQSPKPGDMMISDTEGIISSIVYGPDQRTRIRADTTRALFTVYAPAGIAREAVESHLSEIATLAQLIAPARRVEFMQVYPGD